MKNLVLSFLIALPFAAAQAEEVKAITPADAQVIFDSAIEVLQKKIAEAKSLTPEKRAEFGRQLEAQADHMRIALDEQIVQISKLSNGHFIVGIIVTLGGEITIPLRTHWVAGPAGELGLAGFMKNDSTMRFTTAIIGGGFTEVITDTNAIQNRSGMEAGMRVKFLIARRTDEIPVVNLRDFTGAYVGAGVEFRSSGNAFAGRLYAKPTTCRNLNPLDCQVYMLSVAMHWASNAAPVNIGLKSFYMTFPNDNGGRGYSIGKL